MVSGLVQTLDSRLVGGVCVHILFALVGTNIVLASKVFAK